MANRFSPQVNASEKQLANFVIQEMGLDGFSVDFNSETSTLLFKSGFKTVEVLTKLISQKRWSDIRLLFRSVLGSAPQHQIYAAENEWSRGEF